MAMLVGVVLGMLITVVRVPFFRVSVLLHPSAKGARGRGLQRSSAVRPSICVGAIRNSYGCFAQPERPVAHLQGAVFCVRSKVH